MYEQEMSDWKDLAGSIVDADRVRYQPPPEVWDNVLAALAETETAIPQSDFQDEHSLTDPVVDSPELSIVPDPVDEVTPHNEVIDLNAERNNRAPATERKRRRHMVLAAAASVLAVVIGISVFTNGEPVETLVAEVTNEALPEAYTGTATATVELDDSLLLEIDFDADLPTGEPIELWVIKTVEGEIADMRSLGIVEPGVASWDWPADLDPTEFSVVDLSIEPDDGDPTHSGRSILRGALTSL